MGRPRRPLAADLLYHVTARGNDRQDIFRDDVDRRSFTALLSSVVMKREWEVHTACLMPNHLHLVVKTPNPDLHFGMRDLLWWHAVRFNQRHGRTDHVFGKRYYSGVVEDDLHHLVLFRYIANNPVKAGLVNHPADYDWSAHKALAHGGWPPPFLSFAGRDQVFRDAASYAAFVSADPAPGDLLGSILALGGTEATRAARRAGFSSRLIAERLGTSSSQVRRLSIVA